VYVCHNAGGQGLIIASVRQFIQSCNMYVCMYVCVYVFMSYCRWARTYQCQRAAIYTIMQHVHACNTLHDVRTYVPTYLPTCVYHNAGGQASRGNTLLRGRGDGAGASTGGRVCGRSTGTSIRQSWRKQLAKPTPWRQVAGQGVDKCSSETYQC